jgi:large subunit ribosomal protein L24
VNGRLKRLKRGRTRVSTMLSKELVDEYKVRSMQVRKGDTVQVLRGNFKGVEGEVTKVDSKGACIHVEGATREKADGTVVFASIHSSKVAIKKLSLDDPRRKDVLERRTSTKRVV